MNINYTGPIYNSSGYSQIKFIFYYLSKLGHNVRIKSIGNKDQISFLYHDDFKKLEGTKLEKPYINISAGIAPQLRRDNEAAYNIAYSMFETSTIPEQWINFYNEFDEIWTPSNFCQRSFNIKDLRCLVSVIPLGVNEVTFSPKRKSSEYFTFLSVGKWIDRKGWDLLINAYTTEFVGNNKVRLCIKTDEQSKTKEELIKDYLTNDRTSHMPRIMVNNRRTDEDSMPLFYQESDCFILPSRGEAFCLPALEAMSCGLPVIISDFGGQLDFVNEENGWLIPINSLKHLSERLCKINAGYSGLWFAEPDIKDIRLLMRCAYENKEERIRKGCKARDSIYNFTWTKVTDKAEKRLKEIWKHISKDEIVEIEIVEEPVSTIDDIYNEFLDSVASDELIIPEEIIPENKTTIPEEIEEILPEETSEINNLLVNEDLNGIEFSDEIIFDIEVDEVNIFDVDLNNITCDEIIINEVI